MMMYEWYDQVQRDVRLAGRRSGPCGAFTALLVASLALGLAATTALLSGLEERPPPVLPVDAEDGPPMELRRAESEAVR